MRKILFRYLSFFILCFFPISGKNKTIKPAVRDPRVAQIAKQHLASIPIDSVSTVENQRWTDYFSVTPYPLLSKRERMRLLLTEVLPRSAGLQDYLAASPKIINSYVWHDLHLFLGPVTHLKHNLLNQIDQTKSCLGRALLGIWLVTPTTQVEQIRQRQAIIKQLNKHPKILHKITQALAAYAEVESGILAAFKQGDLLYKKPLYFKNFYLYSFLQELYKRLLFDIGQIFVPIFVALQPFKNLYHQGFSTYLENNFRKTLLMFQAAINLGDFDWIFPYLKPLIRYTVQSYCFKIFLLIGKFVYTLIVPSIMAFKGYITYQLDIKIKLRRVRDFQTLLGTMKQISSLVASDPLLEKKLALHLKPIRQLLAKSKEKNNFGTLLRLLQSTDLESHSLFLGYYGRLATLFNFLKRYKYHFVEALYSLGTLEAFTSVACLVKATQTNEHGYSYASFITKNKEASPKLKLKDFWNPLLPYNHAISNQLQMGGPDFHMMLLTGPNAGGKSTFLKAVALNVLLAQTLGIIAAKESLLLPFKQLNTYLSIVDNIAAKRSLFLAEVDRLKEHFEAIERLPEGSYSLTIMDEILTGTNPREGEALTCAVLEYMAQNQRNLTLVATHFPRVMKLQEKIPGVCNYQVMILRDPQSNGFSYSYKVLRGRSKEHIAIELLEKEGFEPVILANARKIIKNP